MLRVVAAVAFASVGFFALYESLERPQTQRFGATIVRGGGHVVALTFDDGPNPLVTPQVLDELARDRIHATFFLVGRGVRAHPDLAARIARAGHELGNHTESHDHLNALPGRAAIDAQIDAAGDAIAAATGRRPRLLRPPFGALDYPAVDEAHRLGYTVVMWTAMPLEHEHAGWRGTRAQIADLLRDVPDGAILVLHDGNQGRDGVGGRAFEAAATHDVIAVLRARGFRFVTVSELLAAAGPSAQAR